MKGSVNTFDGDLNKDIDREVLPKGMLRDSWNSRILDKGGTSYSRTRLDGTEEIPGFTLSEGYVPLAIEDFGIISVVISQNGTNTEIGTYPSPPAGLESGPLENTYKPLRNLFNGDIQNPANAVDFRTDSFGYTADSALNVELQEDYDKSLNIILTCKGKKPRIINTGFSIFPDGSFVIEKRNQDSDTNKYTTTNIGDNTSLFVNAAKLPLLEFDGILPGGSLKAGNYRYYLRYRTQDGNETDIIAHSLMCSVFHGNRQGKVAGGLHNEPTDKRVSFNLSQLDTSYQSISVYFSYSSGESAAVSQFYRFTNPVRISGARMALSINGVEEVEPVSMEEAGAIYSTIGAAACAAQIDSRLLLANSTEEVESLEAFRVLAQAFVPKVEPVNIDLPSWGSLNDIYSDRAFMYNDPSYVYNYLGAHSEEAYPYGVVFTLNNGSTTPAFPTRGLIPATTERTAYTFASHTPLLAEDLNEKGIVRYPQRASLQNGADRTEVFGVRFKLDVQTAQQTAALEEVKKLAVGFFFVRGELEGSNRDIVAQGYLINTVTVPMPNGYAVEPMDKEWMGDDGLTLTRDNTRVVPAINFQLEAHKTLHKSELVKVHTGVMPFMQTHMGADKHPFIAERSKSHYSFISNDLITDPEYFQGLAGGNLYHMRVLKHIDLRPVSKRPGEEDVVAYAEVSGSQINPNTVKLHLLGLGGYHTLYMPFAETDAGRTEAVPVARAFFVPGAGMKGDFSALAHFKSYVGYRRKDPEWRVRWLFHNRFNAYMGIQLEVPEALCAVMENSYSPHGEPDKYLPNYNVWGTPLPLENNGKAVLVNIVRDSQLPSRTTLLSQRYLSLDSVRYVPASHVKPIGLLNTGRSFRVFGGDTYINWGFRRLSYAGDREYNVNTGQSIGLLHESRLNPALRTEQSVASTENIDALKSFFPYAANNLGASDGDKRGAGNPWRDRNNGQETEYFNKGYADREKVKVSRTVPDNYIQTGKASYTRPTRITVSEQHVLNQFENSYRKFLGINYRDYDFQYGEIINIFPKGDTIVMIQERGVGVLPINQRVQVGRDAGGSIYTEAASFLPPKARMISKQVGAQSKGATISTDSFVYGVDVINKKIWREEGERVNVLSENRLESYLGTRLNGTTRVSTGWHRDLGEIYFTFFLTDGTFTVIYNEKLDKFVCFSELSSTAYGYLLGQMLSYQDGKFHWHDKGAPGNFYGTTHPTRLSFVVNEALDMEKTYDFFNILSNECPPTRIEFRTEKLGSVLEVGIDALSGEENVRYRGSKFVGNIEKNEELREEDPLLGDGSDTRIRDRFLEVTLVYEGEQQLSLNAFVTYYRQSIS